MEYSCYLRPSSPLLLHTCSACVPVCRQVWTCAMWVYHAAVLLACASLVVATGEGFLRSQVGRDRFWMSCYEGEGVKRDSVSTAGCLSVCLLLFACLAVKLSAHVCQFSCVCVSSLRLCLLSLSVCLSVCLSLSLSPLSLSLSLRPLSLSMFCLCHPARQSLSPSHCLVFCFCLSVRLSVRLSACLPLIICFPLRVLVHVPFRLRPWLCM